MKDRITLYKLTSERGHIGLKEIRQKNRNHVLLFGQTTNKCQAG